MLFRSVATVTSKGKVTAKKAGTATITATAKDNAGKKASCKVTVNPVTPSATATPTPAPTNLPSEPYGKEVKINDYQAEAVGTAYKHTGNNKVKTATGEKFTTNVTIAKKDTHDANNQYLEINPYGYDGVPIQTITLPAGMPFQ